MKKSYLLIFLIAASLLQYSCRSKKFFATPPDYNPQENAYVPNPSLINLNITIPMKTLNTAVNKELKGLIYEDNDYSNNNEDNLKVRVWRTKRKVKIDGYKEKIRIQLPLEIWASYRWQGCNICPTVEKSTAFEMSVQLTTVIRIGQEWQALLTTTATDISFSKEPTLDFGPVQIPITRVVKSALSKNLPSITSELDSEIEKNVPIKEYMTEAWEELQQPILMDSTYKAWLKVIPQEIFMMPLNNTSKEVRLTAGISTFIETKLGGKPKTELITELAPPVIKKKIDSRFDIEVPVVIDFDMATELARKNLKDSVFNLGKKKQIKVEDINIYGKGGDVFIKTDLSGKFNGVVYLRGRPAIDTITNKIYFKDLDFDINTKNALYKLAAWMAHGTFKKIMAREFQYDISDDLNGAVSAIQTYLDGYTYDNLLTINGRMGDLKLKDIYTNEEEIRAVFMADGQATINVENLSVQ